MNPNQRVSRNHYIRRVKNEKIYLEPPTNIKKNIPYIFNNNNTDKFNNPSKNFQSGNPCYKNIQIKHNQTNTTNYNDIDYQNVYMSIEEKRNSTGIIYDSPEKIQFNLYRSLEEDNNNIKKSKKKFYFYKVPMKQIIKYKKINNNNFLISSPGSLCHCTDINNINNEEINNRKVELNNHNISFKTDYENNKYYRNKIIKKNSYTNKYNSENNLMDNRKYDKNNINYLNYEINSTFDSEIVSNKNDSPQRLNQRRIKYKLINNVNNNISFTSPKNIKNYELSDYNLDLNSNIQSESKIRRIKRIYDKKKLINYFKIESSNESKSAKKINNETFFQSKIQNNIIKDNLNNVLIKKEKSFNHKYRYKNKYNSENCKRIETIEKNNSIINERGISPQIHLTENIKKVAINENNEKIKKEWEEINNKEKVRFFDKNMIYKNIKENPKILDYDKNKIQRIQTFSKKISFDLSDKKDENNIIKKQKSFNNKKIINIKRKYNNIKSHNEMVKAIIGIKRVNKKQNISMEICNVSNVNISGTNNKSNDRNIIIIINNNEKKNKKNSTNNNNNENKNMINNYINKNNNNLNINNEENINIIKQNNTYERKIKNNNKNISEKKSHNDKNNFINNIKKKNLISSKNNNVMIITNTDVNIFNNKLRLKSPNEKQNKINIPQTSININISHKKKNDKNKEFKDINENKNMNDSLTKNDKKPNYNNNDFVNEQNKELKSVIQHKIERKRPVYNLPPSQKRSVSQGKPFNLINKYYDENFILEDDEEENIKLNEDIFLETQVNNINYLNN